MSSQKHNWKIIELYSNLICYIDKIQFINELNIYQEHIKNFNQTLNSFSLSLFHLNGVLFKTNKAKIHKDLKKTNKINNWMT